MTIFSGLAERLGIAEAVHRGPLGAAMAAASLRAHAPRATGARGGSSRFRRVLGTGELILPTEARGRRHRCGAFRRDPDHGAIADPERQDRDRLRNNCELRLCGLSRTSDLAAAGGSRRVAHLPLQLDRQSAGNPSAQPARFRRPQPKSKITGREPVRINPLDAAARGIRDGDIVRLFNARGACLAGCSVRARRCALASSSSRPALGTTPRIPPADKHRCASTATRTFSPVTSAPPNWRRAAPGSSPWSRSNASTVPCRR